MFLFLDPVVQFGQVFQAAHVPGHVVQAHLPRLRTGGVFAHFHQGDFVGVAQVGAHKGRPPGGEAVGVKAKQVFIPVAGLRRVADEDVDMASCLGV